MGLGRVEIARRINLVSRPPHETVGKINKDDVVYWAEFFEGYGAAVVGLSKTASKRLGGAFAQVFALGHEYHRFYGELWEKPSQEGG
jgi:hypothetical protein